MDLIFRDILNGSYSPVSSPVSKVLPSFVFITVASSPFSTSFFPRPGPIILSKWPTDVSGVTLFSQVFSYLQFLVKRHQLMWSLTMLTVNDQRTARVADLLSDFRTLQYYIAAAPTEPENQDDYYTEGWAALRQCCIDGQHILNCAAETRVPRVRGGPEEQAKAELQQ